MATIRERYIQFLTSECNGKIIPQTSYDGQGNLIEIVDKDVLVQFVVIRKDGSPNTMYMWIGPKGAVKWNTTCLKDKAYPVVKWFLLKMKRGLCPISPSMINPVYK